MGLCICKSASVAGQQGHPLTKLSSSRLRHRSPLTLQRISLPGRRERLPHPHLVSVRVRCRHTLSTHRHSFKHPSCPPLQLLCCLPLFRHFSRCRPLVLPPSVLHCPSRPSLQPRQATFLLLWPRNRTTTSQWRQLLRRTARRRRGLPQLPSCQQHLCCLHLRLLLDIRPASCFPLPLRARNLNRLQERRWTSSTLSTSNFICMSLRRD